MIRGLAFAALLGCGDNLIPPQPDAPSAVQSGDVTVTTAVRCCAAIGTPQAGVIVEVVQPDGTAGDEQTTDATGEVTLHHVIAGASITAVYPAVPRAFGFDEQEFTTVLAVEPGDHLTFGGGFAAPSLDTTDSMVVEFPTYPTAVSYSAVTPCGIATAIGQTSSRDSIAVPLGTTCERQTAMIAVLASDGVDVIASGFLLDAPFTAGQVAHLQSWVPNQSTGFTVTFDGITSGLQVQALDGTAALPGDLAYPLFTLTSAMTSSTSLASTVELPSGVQRVIGHAQLRNQVLSQIDSYRSVPAAAGEALLSAPVVPWIGGLSSNLALRQARWLISAGTYDAAVLTLDWSDLTTHQFHWTVIVPPGVTEIELPAASGLATALAASTTAGQRLQLVELPTAASYDELRRVPEWQIAHPDGAVLAGQLGTAEVALGQ